MFGRCFLTMMVIKIRMMLLHFNASIISNFVIKRQYAYDATSIVVCWSMVCCYQGGGMLRDFHNVTTVGLQHRFSIPALPSKYPVCNNALKNNTLFQLQRRRIVLFVS